MEWYERTLISDDVQDNADKENFACINMRTSVTFVRFPSTAHLAKFKKLDVTGLATSYMLMLSVHQKICENSVYKTLGT